MIDWWDVFFGGLYEFDTVFFYVAIFSALKKIKTKPTIEPKQFVAN